MKSGKFIVDGHLDLSMNAMQWNRDIRKTVHDLRLSESGMTDKPDRGNNTVAFPEMRAGNIGLCIGTLIARYAKPTHPLKGWNSPEQAWATTQGQLAWYEEMERQGEIIIIRNNSQLINHLERWQKEKNYLSIGVILSLEGADSLISMGHLTMMQQKGLRAIGPAHYGPGTYAYGTDSDGSIGAKGRMLLQEMEKLNLVLDVTHLSDTSFYEALDFFKGRIWASHNNCRALVDHNRQFTDEQIKIIIERKGVIGIPLDAWMMVPGWERGISNPVNTKVTLETMIDHMVHVCTLSGNVNHVAIGTDLDGGFGTEQGPSDLDTIADLQKLDSMLIKRGFNTNEIKQIFSENWLRILSEVL